MKSMTKNELSKKYYNFSYLSHNNQTSWKSKALSSRNGEHEAGSDFRLYYEKKLLQFFHQINFIHVFKTI